MSQATAPWWEIALHMLEHRDNLRDGFAKHRDEIREWKLVGARNTIMTGHQTKRLQRLFAKIAPTPSRANEIGCEMIGQHGRETRTRDLGDMQVVELWIHRIILSSMGNIPARRSIPLQDYAMRARVAQIHLIPCPARHSDRCGLGDDRDRIRKA